MNKKGLRKEKLWAADLVLALVLLAADQLTKWLAITRLKGKPAYVLLEDVLEFSYLENRGSAFGMFQNQKILLLSVGFVFLALLLFVLYRIPQKSKYLILHVCIAMIVAGGVGNMIDRFRLGYVVDFISFVLIHYPVFNVADIYVVLAVLCMLVLFLFVYQEEDLAFLSLKRQ